MTKKRKETSTRQIAVGVAIGVLSTAAVKALFSGPSAEVIAKVSYGELHYSPDIAAALTSLENGISKDVEGIEKDYREARDEITSSVFADAFGSIDGIDDFSKERLATIAEITARKKTPDFDSLLKNRQWISSIGLKLHEQPDSVRHVLTGRFVSAQRGFWRAEILNNGNEQASGISIDLPHMTHASIARHSGEPTYSKINGTIEIGTLRPSEKVEVTAWTNQNLNLYDIDEITLRHSKGKGAVSATVRANKFWRDIQDIWSFFRYGIVWIIICLASVSLFKYFKYWKKSSSEEKGTVE
jgi:hypothetical protein